MSYIDRNLLPDERILFRTKKHLIIFFIPAVMAAFSVYASAYMASDSILTILQWAPWLVTGLVTANVALNYWTSEFAVTNKRLMMREGFFVRHSNELRLTTISQVNVDQSLIGQILNYGTISINAFGAFDRYNMIDQPFKFQQMVNQQLDSAVSGGR